jgi:amidase
MGATRRGWPGVLLVAWLLPGAGAATCVPAIYEATLEQIVRQLDDGCLTSEQLVQRYLDRIAAFEPAINAVTVVNEAALQRARALDAERRDRGPRGLLHGVPILVKDNIGTADMVTSVGTVGLRHSRPAQDATVVERLRRAGAIVIAKTNMSELAQSHGRLGYSATGGQTRNPYDPTRDASGSSTGSAVGVAANFAVLALGTDTAGSVRGPAATTGLVGLRPTHGLVSRAGVAPVSFTLDTVGPMARSVYGVAAMLEVIAGPDPAEARTEAGDVAPPSAYVAALGERRLDGTRIGVARDFMGGHPDVDAAVERALDILRALGAEVVEVALPAAVTDAGGYLPQVIGAEFRPLFERYLQGLGGDAPDDLEDLADVAAVWGEARPEQAMNPALLESLYRALDHPALADTDYLFTVLYLYPAARDALRDAFERHRLDAFVFPTLACPPAPLPGELQGAYRCAVEDAANAGYLRVASVTGFPDVSVPAGLTAAGLPIGLSLLGRPWSEANLLGIAQAFERASPARRPPAHAPPLP